MGSVRCYAVDERTQFYACTIPSCEGRHPRQERAGIIRNRLSRLRAELIRLDEAELDFGRASLERSDSEPEAIIRRP